jgi:pectin methylesterase-like acyl-CoA thioesterase
MPISTRQGPDRGRWFLRYALLFIGLLLGRLSVSAQGTPAVTVAKDGTGNFTTVQAAINAAPTNATAAYVIFIKNGKYKEKINVAANKPFLQLVGESVGGVILTYDDYSGKANPAGGTFGTANSASVTVAAADFSAFNITFENTTGVNPGTQALAINITGDRGAFRNCRFLGGQDTVYAGGNATRQYFRNCYIDGNTDFIFGNTIAVFDRCVIYPKTRNDNGNLGYITAANTPAGQTYGYVFRNCIIPGNQGATTYTLGRPWQNDAATAAAAKSNTKVVFLNSRLGAGIIRPEGWSIWDTGTDVSLITYGEFRPRDFRGNLVNVSSRVNWSKQLTVADTAQYQTTTVLGTWNPCTVATSMCAAFAPSIAATNFLAVKGASASAFTWNASWAIAQVQYELMRSSTRKGTYTSVKQQTAANDTTYNFQTTDALPAPGSSYFYYLRSTKTGLTTHITDTVEISRTPTITVTGTLGTLTQYSNGPSAARVYTVAGANLTTDLTITPPAGVELSANGGTTWSSSPLVLPQANNTLATTTISVRLNTATLGSSSGTITHTSAPAVPVALTVVGTRVATAQPVSGPLQWWPMARNAQDSAAVRSSQLAASMATLRKFVVSSGSAAATLPPYSARYGQAFAPQADGGWTTAVGGNGGNLNRTYYEQFVITAATGASLRLDSLALTTYVNASTSNTKLAVVWSRSGFRTDSADVSGGVGPSGVFASTANGAFASPVLLATSSTYRFNFLAAGGINLTAGQTLTVRLYYSCGSSTLTTRFALLKNVILKGEAGATAPPPTSTPVAMPAFPGAEGAGKYTTGGRGSSTAPTTVVEVTNLNDAGAGSLRQALSGTLASRTVVFRVCGTINLLSQLNIPANTTIAGQTAPGDGICLADKQTNIKGNNVIVRFVRFRLGDRYQNLGMVNGSGDEDNFDSIGGYTGLVVDHCTFSWGEDESLSCYKGDNTTLQWNIISEGLNYSYHFETGDTDFERHGYGGIWGGRHASFHHNLLAHLQGRNPRFDGSRNLAPNTPGQENAEFVNNVIYDWGAYTVNGGEGGNYNIVSNYYKYGPSTGTGSSVGVAVKSQLLNPYKTSTLPYGQYYLTGNYADGYPAVSARNWRGVSMNGGAQADTTLAKATTAFAIGTDLLPTQAAQAAYTSVLAGAGCVLPVRDAIDQRIVLEVQNRTGTIIDVQGGYPHGTPYSTSQAAWPVLTCGAPPTDTDHDGMPDAWETANGLNPNDPADRATLAANGYANLENYLNGLVAATVLATAPASATAGQLQAYPNPVGGGTLTLTRPRSTSPGQVVVYDLRGRQVLAVSTLAGAADISLPASNLSPGLYLVRYTDAGQTLTTKFTKE